MKQSNYLIGTVGTDVRGGKTKDGKTWASFRMAVNHDYLNRETGTFETADTTWFDVTAFGILADNMRRSLATGDSVFVVGRIRTRDWSAEDGRQGTAVQILADAVGLNLQFTQAVSTKRLEKTLSAELGELESSGGDVPDDPFASSSPVGAAAGGDDAPF